MKIKCVSNQGKDLNKCNLSDAESGYTETTIFEVTPDKEYTVYGLIMYHGTIWYYIAQDDYSDGTPWAEGVPFPRWQPAELFKVIDNRISSTWVMGTEFGEKGEILPILTYKKWAMAASEYYDALSEGFKEEVEIFRKYKKIMDEEFL